MKTTVLEREASVTTPTNVDQLLREEAIKARDMVERGYMKLAKCLYDIYNQSLYENWDFLTFENYVDTELQINYRKAMYLVEIYNKALMLNMDMGRLERLGWTKARELIRVVDQANADEWMTLAENSTFKELNVMVKQEKDKTVDRSSVIDEVPTITTITFKLGMAEHSVIREALDESAKLINTDDLALALAAICQDWIEAKGVVPLQSTLEDRVENLKRIYGRNIIIVGVAGSENEEDEDDEADSDSLLDLDDDL